LLASTVVEQFVKSLVIVIFVMVNSPEACGLTCVSRVTLCYSHGWMISPIDSESIGGDIILSDCRKDF
jgi:hypothetical protein